MSKNKLNIKLSPEKRDEMVNRIKSYFLKERDEDLGDLAAGFILNFFLDELAVEVYNQAVYDCYSFINERIEDVLELQK